MEASPEPILPTKPAPSRLVWVLALIAVASTGIAAFAWSQGRNTDPGPSAVSLADPAAGDLTSADRAPDFSVPTIDGSNFSLYDHLELTGKPVLLNLWASWCPPCRSEMPALDAAAKRYPNVTFIGVAVQDDPVAAESFAKQIGVSYTIGLDEREEVNDLYPHFGLPVTYLISPEGVILDVLIAELDEADIDAAIGTWFGG